MELKENFLQIHSDMIHRLMAACTNQDVVKDIETHLRKHNPEYGAEARMVFETHRKMTQRSRAYCIEFLRAHRNTFFQAPSEDGSMCKYRIHSVQLNALYRLLPAVGKGRGVILGHYDLITHNPQFKNWKSKTI